MSVLVSDSSNCSLVDTDLNPTTLDSSRPVTVSGGHPGRHRGAPRLLPEEAENLAGPGVLGGDVGPAVQDALARHYHPFEDTCDGRSVRACPGGREPRLGSTALATAGGAAAEGRARTVDMASR
jgi:hypothetical protein